MGGLCEFRFSNHSGLGVGGGGGVGEVGRGGGVVKWCGGAG